MKSFVFASVSAFLFLAFLPKQALAQSPNAQTNIDQVLPAVIKAQAETGDNFAQSRLGIMYCEGRGMEKDFVEGYAWLNLAARTDDAAAKQRDALELRMTPQQIAEAQKRTKELRAAIEARTNAPVTSSTTNAVASTNALVQTVQPNGPVRETYVGGSIFKEEHKRAMRTAIGTKDLFGRKEYAGFTELRFQGITHDGLIVLRLTEVDTQSKPRTSQVFATANTGKSGYVNGVYVDGRSTIQGTIKHPVEELPPNTTEFTFDPTKEAELAIAGYRVRFLEATQQKLKYSYAK